MGTRTLTVVIDVNSGHEVMCMGMNHGGFQDEHGFDLCDLLRGMLIVRGIEPNAVNVANGAGCLAAQIVAKFKENPGGVYLMPTGTRLCFADRTYVIKAEVGKPLHIQEGNYSGPLDEYSEYIEHRQQGETT